MKFSEKFIQKVLESNNIVDVIGQYSQLKPAGNGLMGLCPFHGERTPSFSVSETKQVYHCFGCKAQGNVYRFVQDYNGMTFPEAVEYLARRANLPLEVLEREEDSEKKDHLQLLMKASRWAASFFVAEFKKLPDTHPAKQYAKKRNLTEDIVETFKIGFAPDEWEGLVRFFQQKKVPLELGAELGLIKRRQSGNGYHDVFRGRLIFPILSTLGDPVGFGGRVLGDEMPKYLNSSESPIFHKGKTLYGLKEATKHIRLEDRIILVEGYMDVIALYQMGIKNVVAALGTAFTHEHAKTLRKYGRNVIVLFDGDQAGQKAAERSLPILLGGGIFPKGLILPDELDPDEFIKERGVGALIESINQAPELFDMIFSSWLKGYRGDTTEKITLVEKLAPVFTQIGDQRLYSLYFQNVCERLRVKPDWLRDALKQQAHPERKGHESTVNNADEDPESTKKPIYFNKIELKKPPQEELYLLQTALLKQSNLKLIIESGVIDQLSNEGVKEVFLRIHDVSRQEPENFDKLLALLTTYVEEPHVLTLAPEINLEEQPEKEAKFIKDCIAKVQKKYFQQRVWDLKEENRGREVTPEILEQIMNIQRSRLSLDRSKDTPEDN